MLHGPGKLTPLPDPLHGPDIKWSTKMAIFIDFASWLHQSTKLHSQKLDIFFIIGKHSILV